MVRNSKPIALICGAVSIAVTVIFYLLIFGNIFTIPMRWISLIFLVLAESIGTAKALNIKKSIFGVANIITSLFHIGIVLVMSIMFVNVLPLFISKYILLNILGLCVLLAVDVIIVCFGEHTDDKNSELTENQAVMDSLYTTAKSLAIENSESAYGKSLDELSELIRYSDNSALSNDEVLISEKLEELQEVLSTDDCESVPRRISDIENIIKLRSLKIKGVKRGHY